METRKIEELALKPLQTKKHDDGAEEGSTSIQIEKMVRGTNNIRAFLLSKEQKKGKK